VLSLAAAETIFIADVICIVDETEVILLRISFKFAILLWVLRFGFRCELKTPTPKTLIPISYILLKFLLLQFGLLSVISSVNLPAFKASKVALCLLRIPRNLSQILSLCSQEHFSDFFEPA
jgi:hypothetical protein